MNAEQPERLIEMANQIARFFASQPRGSAPDAVADHLRAYWDPAMRRRIVAWTQAGGAGLDPVALDAVLLMAAGGGSAHVPPGDDAG